MHTVDHSPEVPGPGEPASEVPGAGGPRSTGRRSTPRWVAPAATGAVLAAGTVALGLARPGDGGVSICASQSVFGFDCPLCGGLRCVGALARGDVLAAADHNVLLAVALPLLAAGWAVWFAASLRGRSLRLPRVPVPAWVGLGVLLVVFTVARNLGDDGLLGWLAATATT